MTRSVYDRSFFGTWPPTAQNFLNFMQFFGKFWQNRRLAPLPGGLAPPRTGNPGSAPDGMQFSEFNP